jgi:hypothetical protein
VDTPTRYTVELSVPEDETCFPLYEGPSVQSVRAAARRAGLGAGCVEATLKETS